MVLSENNFEVDYGQIIFEMVLILQCTKYQCV